ncbi:MAG TPA: hypothetical protein PLO37_15085 [Candidatus Hydrogenedentes bacterium]|nr:hypothetical protein [Candidatus Hydrogenedentota bacterium]HPG68171.1 hypothetical protein [Candidatus Hydrogenedentota bacterium]
MSTRRRIVIPLVVILAFAGIITSQQRIDATRHKEDLETSLLYLPNERLLTHFTGGLSCVVADVLWIQCIQYTAKRFRSEEKLAWLNHMCRTITRLDPYFVAVYRYGGVFLAAVNADDTASLSLLHDGIVNNPDTWQLPYEMASVYLLNRREEPGSQEKAAAYLSMAVATGKAPRMVVELAKAVMAGKDLFEIERTMWEGMLESDDAFMRQLAERKLVELGIRETCRGFNDAVRQYVARHGELPPNLDVLVEGGTVPPDALGGRYFMAPGGVVRNTTLLDAEVAERREAIQDAIQRFHDAQGRWPLALDHLVNSGLLDSVPAHPYPGRAWHYDPKSGAVD